MTEPCTSGWIGLKNPDLILLDDMHHGGNQEWYEDEWHRRAGCGPTTASTLMYYLAQRDESKRALWPTANERGKEDFVRLMHTVWD